MTHQQPRPPTAADAAVTGWTRCSRPAGRAPCARCPAPPGCGWRRRWPPGRTVARRGAGLAAELARIGLGRSAVAPGADDERYRDPAWTRNPLLRRLAQTHLATSAAAEALVGDAGLSPADDARVRAALDVLAGALAPSSSPLHPDVLRAAVDPGGTNAVRGLRRLVRDLTGPARVPAVPAACEIGTDVAATPGAVVLRTPVVEMVQFLPQTELVHDVPLLVVPPVLNRYYVADLAPGRSVVEHLVRSGVQVFALSWRNPTREQAHWDLDTYARAVLDGLDAAEHIARTQRVSLMAFGAGATISAMLLAHLAATGSQDRVAAVTLAGGVLDGRTDAAAARAAVAASQRAG